MVGIGRGLAFALAACAPVLLTADGARSETIIMVVQTSAAEIEFWRSVSDSKNSAELEAYLKAYPNGKFAPLAKIRLRNLKSVKQQGATGGDSNTDVSPAGAKAIPDVNIPPVPPHKQAGWIGIPGRNVTEARARELGLVAASGYEVTRIVPGSPAARAGLEPGDVVLSLAGVPVTDAPHLIRLSRAQAPGKTIDLEIWRGRARRPVKVTPVDAVEFYWAGAQRGDVEGMLTLGHFYRYGDAVEPDLREAARWYRKAADAGDADAMFLLGQAYHGGFGVELDAREAAHWYRKAAEAGIPRAMFAFATFCDNGIGVERDPGKAMRWYKRAADLGDPEALNNYGTHLMDGRGVEKNETLGIEYFRRAARLGHARAIANIGWAYFYGTGVDNDPVQAARWFKDAANRGASSADRGLGFLYEQGLGGVPRNRADAIRHYRKAAEAGDTQAVARLKALKTSVYDPGEVQQLLSDLGFDPGPVNGKPGRKTGQAIRAFQKNHGLPVNGDASLALVGQLRAALKQKTAAESAAAPPPGAAKTSDLDLKDLEKLDSRQ